MIAPLPFAILQATGLGPHATDVHDAHPVTGPERLPGEEASLPWIWIALGATALVLLIASIRRRRRQPIIEPAAHEWAQVQLARLASRNGDGATADEIAAIVRGYLRRRYDVPESLTTQELERSHGGAADLGEWLSLLQRCDLTKFAQIGFTAVEAAQTIRRAQTLLTATLPISEASPAAKTGEFR